MIGQLLQYEIRRNHGRKPISRVWVW